MSLHLLRWPRRWCSERRGLAAIAGPPLTATTTATRSVPVRRQPGLLQEDLGPAQEQRTASDAHHSVAHEHDCGAAAQHCAVGLEQTETHLEWRSRLLQRTLRLLADTWRGRRHFRDHCCCCRRLLLLALLLVLLVLVLLLLLLRRRLLFRLNRCRDRLRRRFLSGGELFDSRLDSPQLPLILLRVQQKDNVRSHGEGTEETTGDACVNEGEPGTWLLSVG